MRRMEAGVAASTTLAFSRAGKFIRPRTPQPRCAAPWGVSWTIGTSAVSLGTCRLLGRRKAFFSSGEMAHEAMFRISAEAARAPDAYHARYRGKTAAFGHFVRTKYRIAKIKVCKWPRTQGAVEKLVIDSYRNEDQVRATFAAGTHRRGGGRVKLIIPGIPSAQHMERVTDPESNQDVLAAEGETGETSPYAPVLQGPTAPRTLATTRKTTAHRTPRRTRSPWGKRGRSAKL